MTTAPLVCVNCGYDLSGSLTTPVCPECATPLVHSRAAASGHFLSPRHLRSTSRALLVLIISSMLLVLLDASDAVMTLFPHVRIRLQLSEVAMYSRLASNAILEIFSIAAWLHLVVRNPTIPEAQLRPVGLRRMKLLVLAWLALFCASLMASIVFLVIVVAPSSSRFIVLALMWACGAARSLCALTLGFIGAHTLAWMVPPPQRLGLLRLTRLSWIRAVFTAALATSSIMIALQLGLLWTASKLYLHPQRGGIIATSDPIHQATAVAAPVEILCNAAFALLIAAYACRARGAIAIALRQQANAAPTITPP